MGIKKPFIHKEDEDKLVHWYHPFGITMHFSEYKYIPIPVTEEIRRAPNSIGFSAATRRNFMCRRLRPFQSCRTLPESRTWNDYFPLSSLLMQYLCFIISLDGELSMTDLTWFNEKNA